MTDEQASQLEKKIDKLLSVLPALEALCELVVLQQKDAAAISGVSNVTIRNRADREGFPVLGRDGSRLNYITLKSAGELKRKRRKSA